MSASGRHRKSRGDIEVGFLSHTGMVRSENQDYFGFSEPEPEEELHGKGRLLVVCDGMGGHNGGSVASRTTVEMILDSFIKTGTHNLKRLLSTAIDRANSAVREKGARDVTLRNMGTTCVALALRGARAQVAHIGDSRCYLVRDSKIERITRDHTYLNDLIEIGLLTPEKAKNHPERNIITRCVGMGDVLQVDFNLREARSGDMFLLCSDGLYNHVEDEEMLDAAIKSEPQVACQGLVDLANQRGGEDNITVAILKVVSVPEAFKKINEEDVETEEVTADTVTPVITVESGEETPRTSFPISGGTTAEAPTRDQTRLNQTMPIERPKRMGLKAWLIVIAIELVVLVVLQAIIRGY